MPTSCLGGVRGWFFIRCWHCSFLVPSAKNCYCSIQNRICQHKWRSTSNSFDQKEKISLWVPESHFISRVKPCKITMYNEILSYYPERWRFCGIFTSRIRDLAGSVFFRFKMIIIFSRYWKLSRAGSHYRPIFLNDLFIIFWNNNSMLAYRVVCCSHQSDRLVYLSRTNQIAALGYVSRTNQIAALGYVSRTNHIIAFEYPAPITAFGYCFLVNDVMDQRMTLIRNYGLIW